MTFPATVRRLPRLLLALGLAAASVLGAEEIEIRGRLLGDDGRPLAGAEVRLHRWLSETESGRLVLAGHFEPEAVAAVVSGDDGRFRLLAPGADRWQLAVRHDGHVPVVHAMVPLDEPQDLGDVALPRSRPQRIRLVDEDGRGVAGFPLTAIGHSSSWSREEWSLETRRVETGEDGGAALPRLADESLIVWGMGRGRFLFEPLEPGTDPARLVLRDRLREARATDVDGRPLAGVVGLLVEGLAFGPSGKDGVLEIPWVPARRIAAYRGVGDGPLPLLFFDEDGSHYGRVPPIETEDGLAVRLPATRAVPGQVLDEATGEGIAGALVSTDVGFARSGRGGAFTVRISPGPSTWLIVTAPGYAEESVNGPMLDLGPDKEVRIRLRKSSSLAGRVVDAAGRGVPGARVRARVDPRFTPESSMSRLYSIEDEVVADGAGAFRLKSLTHSVAYLVGASAPGFAPREVSVPPLERDTPAEPLEIALEPGRTASGTVLDAGEQPVAGAEVRLYSTLPRGEFYDPRSFDERVVQAVSDEEGRFQLEDLKRGIFRLRVESPGHARLEVSGVEIGDEPGVDLGILHVETGAVLEGRVLDTEGRPIAGAQVVLPVTNPQPLLDAETPAVRTESDGSFRFPDLSKSVPYAVSVYAEGYSSASVEGVSVERDGPLTVTLERASALRGRVVDGAGRPVEAEMALRRVVGLSSSTTGTTTDPMGRFEFPNLAAGRVTLSASSAEGAADPLELELRPGESRDVEMVLRPAAKVLGTLLSPGGEPVAGAHVRIARSRPGEVDQEAVEADSWTVQSFATSDGDGRFALSGLRAGTYRLHAAHPDYGSVSQTLELEGGALRELSLRFEGLGERFSVAGRVVNERGEAVPGTVRLVDERNTSIDFRSTPDGQFELRARRPGIYAVVADSPELAAGRSEPFELTAGGVRDVVVELGQGATVSGRLLGLEARDFPRVRLSAYQREAQVSRGGVVDREGRYRISHLAAGDWRVSAALQGTDRTVSAQATVGEAGDAVSLDLEFAEVSRLTGRVLLDGRPFSAGHIRATCGKGPSADQKLGSEGRFEIPDVPNGDCTLEVTGTERAVAGALAVDMPASDVVVDLRSGTLSGSVSSAADRRPLSGAEIVVSEKGRAFGYAGSSWYASEATASDAAGRFTFPAITPGRWVLQVDLDGYESLARKVELTGLAEEVEIVLRPTAPAVLVVRSADGSVPSQVTIIALDESGRVTSSQVYRPDAEGRVVLRRLGPDVRRLRVTGENGEAAEVDVEVRGEPVSVVLARGGAQG